MQELDEQRAYLSEQIKTERFGLIKKEGHFERYSDIKANHTQGCMTLLESNSDPPYSKPAFLENTESVTLSNGMFVYRLWGQDKFTTTDEVNMYIKKL